MDLAKHSGFTNWGDYKSSKLWSSQLWTQFKQLRIEAWKSQDFNGVWARDLAIPVRRSNQLSYEATDFGSWSFVSSNEETSLNQTELQLIESNKLELNEIWHLDRNELTQLVLCKSGKGTRRSIACSFNPTSHRREKERDCSQSGLESLGSSYHTPFRTGNDPV